MDTKEQMGVGEAIGRLRLTHTDTLLTLCIDN